MNSVIEVDWGYQAIMGAAISVGFLLSRRTQRDLSMDRWQRYGILAGAFCGAMIGAKIPFLFGDFETLLSGAAWFQNGKTILCGLVGGYFGVELAKWCLDVKTKTGDSFAVPVAASIAVGRLACFHAGCCFGTPTDLPWGVVFSQIDGAKRHPTQIYESIFHATAAVSLAILFRRGLLKGNLVKLYLIMYAMYRFVTEMIRPEARLLGNLTAYQWGSLLIIAVFSLLWYHDRSNPNERLAPQYD